MAAQNKVTQDYLAKIPFRESLKSRLTELANYEKIGVPFIEKGKYYFFKNDGLQNQSVLYVKNTLDGEAQVLLDPNKLSDDGTVALKGIKFSRDGKYMSYAISRSGSDWEEIYVMDLATRSLTQDKIEWAKFSSVSWCGNGFYYSAYDAPKKGKEFSNVRISQDFLSQNRYGTECRQTILRKQELSETFLLVVRTRGRKRRIRL